MYTKVQTSRKLTHNCEILGFNSDEDVQPNKFDIVTWVKLYGPNNRMINHNCPFFLKNTFFV